MRLRFRSGFRVVLLFVVSTFATVNCCAAPVTTTTTATTTATRAASQHRVIVFVWDGLRPDFINIADTPNLASLRELGVNFLDHHSTYPTLTMINAASFATGAYPGTHGFYGNSFWAPQASGRDSANREVDFSTPVFTEDYAILRDLDAAVQGRLLEVPTLVELAQRAGKPTAIVGKVGPTFLQSKGNSAFFLDDKTVMPLTQAKALSEAGFPLPKLWANAFTFDSVPPYRTTNEFSSGNHYPLMNDGRTADPSKLDAVTNVALNAYQADVFLNYVLPTIKPQLAMLWLKNPDSTEHAYGPGSAATRNALHANDAILGALLSKLDSMGWRDTTNIIIVSDHGHSHISGSLQQFPLRAINDGDIGAVNADGFSVSGEVRSADLLRRAGLMAFDGGGAQCNPVMSGIKEDGTSIYTHGPVNLYSACKAPSGITGNFMIPDAEYLHQPYAVIALDGGSEYYYVPSHDKQFVQKLVTFFQTHKQYGAVFVDATRYGELRGTLPLSAIHLQNTARNSPDIIVSFAFDAQASINHVPGIEYCGGAGSSRGMHGSFSPRDVHNVMIATGPDFKTAFRNELPSGNVDVAPTIAYLLGLDLKQADGRVLNEALLVGNAVTSVKQEVIRPANAAVKLSMIEPTDPDGHDIDSAATSYTIELHTKLVKQKRGGVVREYRYFDSANAIRR